jgi:hypothetical protein
MRHKLMIAGLALAVAAPTFAVPTFADARDACQQRAHERKVTGTLIGAGVGALVGNAITDNAGGTIIGGVGGAVVGNQIARKKCYSYRSASKTRYRAAPTSYRSASYAPRCRYESRPYYNERGDLIYAPTQVCR